MIFLPFRSQTAKSGRRVFRYSLDHDHQVTPLHRITPAVRVVFRKFKPSGLQPLDIHHHSAVLGMRQLHQFTAAAYEDEHIPVPDIRPHLLFDNSDKRVDSLAHVCPARTKMVAHRIVETEHGSIHAFGQHRHQHLLAAATEVRFYPIGECQCDSRQIHSGHRNRSG